MARVKLPKIGGIKATTPEVKELQSVWLPFLEAVRKLLTETATDESLPVELGPFGSTPSDEGATYVDPVLTIQPADATHPGAISLSAQTLGSGNKTIQGNIAATNFSGSSSGTNTGDVTIGNFGSSPTPKGLSISGQVITAQPADATNPGLLSTTSQAIKGEKNFRDNTLFGTIISAPQYKIDMDRDVADIKLALYNDNTYRYGFGVQTNQFIANIPDSSASYLWKRISSAATLMTLTGSGALSCDTATFTTSNATNLNVTSKGSFGSSDTTKLVNAVDTASGADGIIKIRGTQTNSLATINAYGSDNLTKTTFGYGNSAASSPFTSTAFIWTINNVELKFIQYNGSSHVERGKIDTSGNFLWDTNVLYVDAVNNRVGINKTPSSAFDVSGAAAMDNTLSVTGAVTFGSVNVYKATTGITAFAGGGQASATQLAAETNYVTTVASANDSVKLPASALGKKVIVYNLGANACDVYPPSSSAIDALGTNNPYSLAAGTAKVFDCQSTTQWRSR